MALYLRSFARRISSLACCSALSAVYRWLFVAVLSHFTNSNKTSNMAFLVAVCRLNFSYFGYLLSSGYRYKRKSYTFWCTTSVCSCIFIFHPHVVGWAFARRLQRVTRPARAKERADIPRVMDAIHGAGARIGATAPVAARNQRRKGIRIILVNVSYIVFCRIVL